MSILDQFDLDQRSSTLKIGFSHFCLLALLVLMLFLSSCASKKIVLPTPEDPTVTLFSKVKDSSKEYKWYSAKAKVRLESSELSGGGKMNIRMVRDSIIWFNFKKVSIEGARALITPDTFSIIYRTEKTYEIGSLTQLLDHFNVPLSFYEMQSYISGEIPLASEASLKYESSSDRHTLSGQDDNYRLQYNFDESLNLNGYTLTDRQNRNLEVELEDWDDTLSIHKQRKLTYKDDSNGKTILSINLSNVEFNVPKKIPFTIPNHYTQY